MKIIPSLTALSALLTAPLFAEYVSRPNQSDDGPWFTGPLLTPSPHTVEKGHWNIEPYFFAAETRGIFNRHWQRKSIPHLWDLIVQVPIQYGITPIIDLQCTPEFFTKYRRGGVSETHFGDFPVGIDIQLRKESKKEWYPGIKIALKQLFPTGDYEKLNPAKQGADASGGGSYATSVALDIGRVIKLDTRHHMNVRLSLGFTHFRDVKVEGYNAYGGGIGTKGHVNPGDRYSAAIGLEYTLTKHVNLACDAVYTATEQTSFFGAPGVTPTGNPAIVGMRSSDTLEFAPALEYNFNANIGIIGGVQFTAFGRNASRPVNYVFAINFYL